MRDPQTLREIAEWLRALAHDVRFVTPEEVTDDLVRLANRLEALCDRLQEVAGGDR